MSKRSPFMLNRKLPPGLENLSMPTHSGLEFSAGYQAHGSLRLILKKPYVIASPARLKKILRHSIMDALFSTSFPIFGWHKLIWTSSSFRKHRILSRKTPIVHKIPLHKKKYAANFPSTKWTAARVKGRKLLRMMRGCLWRRRWKRTRASVSGRLAVRKRFHELPIIGIWGYSYLVMIKYIIRFNYENEATPVSPSCQMLIIGIAWDYYAQKCWKINAINYFTMWVVGCSSERNRIRWRYRRRGLVRSDGWKDYRKSLW